MELYLQICKGFLRSRLLYIYWALSSVALVLTHLNSGLKGSPWLGGSSILLNLSAFAVFYFAFNQKRRELLLGEKSNFLWLMGHINLFRFLLILVFLPFIWLFFSNDAFTQFTLSYTTLSLVPEEKRAAALLDLLRISLPWLGLIAVYFFIDQAARSHIVAQGSSRKTFRKIFQIIWNLKHVLIPFLILEVILMTIYMHDLLDDPIANQAYWGSTLIRIAMVPLKFIFEIGSTLWMANYLTVNSALVITQRDSGKTSV